MAKSVGLGTDFARAASMESNITLRCPYCGADNMDEAIPGKTASLFRCLHCWRTFHAAHGNLHRKEAEQQKPAQGES